MPDIDTMNRFLVGLTMQDRIAIMGPHSDRLTKDEALNLAAWIVALADPTQEKFGPLLEAVLAT